MRTKMCLIEKKEKKDNKDIVCLLLMFFFFYLLLYMDANILYNAITFCNFLD